MTPAHRKLLAPYAAVFAAAERRVAKMSDADLAELEKAACSAASSNCWYAVYRVAKVLMPLIAAEKYSRSLSSNK